MKIRIQNCIQNFILDDFQKHPNDFLKEEEIRSVLFTRIKDELKNCRRNLPIEKLSNYQSENIFEMDFVRCEYSYENYEQKGCSAFDIAILHEDENVWIGKDNWEKYHTGKSRKAQMYWNQPVRVGLEIKAVWHSWEINNRVKGIKSDSKKLKNYLKSNYALQNFKDENGRSFQFDGAALLFASNEINHKCFIESNFEIDKNCSAFCITPTKVYKIQ